jgi:hypothetical protein
LLDDGIPAALITGIHSLGSTRSTHRASN